MADHNDQRGSHKRPKYTRPIADLQSQALTMQPSSSREVDFKPQVGMGFAPQGNPGFLGTDMDWSIGGTEGRGLEYGQTGYFLAQTVDDEATYLPGASNSVAMSFDEVSQHSGFLDGASSWAKFGAYSDTSNQTGENSDQVLLSTPSQGSDDLGHGANYFADIEPEETPRTYMPPHDPTDLLYPLGHSVPRTKPDPYQHAASAGAQDSMYQEFQEFQDTTRIYRTYASVNQSQQNASSWTPADLRMSNFQTGFATFEPPGGPAVQYLRSDIGSPSEASYRSQAMSLSVSQSSHLSRSQSSIPEEDLSSTETITERNGKDVEYEFDTTIGTKNGMERLSGRGSGRKKMGIRQGPLTNEVKDKARAVRKIRACWHCKKHKISCDDGEICQSCVKILKKFPTSLPAEVCCRIGLKDYQGALFPGFLIAHLGKKVIEDFVTENVDDWRNTKDIVVKISAGAVFQPMELRVNPFAPKTSEIIGHWQLSPPQQSQLVQLHAARVGIIGFSTSDMKKLIERHLMAMVKNPFFAAQITAGDTMQIPRQILEIVQNYCSPRKSQLVRKALMLLAAQYCMSRILTFTDESAMNVQQELQQVFVDEVPFCKSSRLLNRQIKFPMSQLQREIARDVLDGLEKSVISQSTKSSWGESFCTLLVLSICMEGLQTAADTFVVSDIEKELKEGVTSQYTRKQSSDACTNIEELPWLGSVRLFHDWYRSHKDANGKRKETSFNPLRAIQDGLSNTGLDETTDEMARAIYNIYYQSYPDILHLSKRPAVVNPGGSAAPRDIQANNNGRLAAKFLQSFFDPNVVIDR